MNIRNNLRRRSLRKEYADITVDVTDNVNMLMPRFKAICTRMFHNVNTMLLLFWGVIWIH